MFRTRYSRAPRLPALSRPAPDATDLDGLLEAGHDDLSRIADVCVGWGERGERWRCEDLERSGRVRKARREIDRASGVVVTLEEDDRPAGEAGVDREGQFELVD